MFLPIYIYIYIYIYIHIMLGYDINHRFNSHAPPPRGGKTPRP